MSLISSKIKNINPSISLSSLKKIKDSQRGNIIALNIGEPDFDTHTKVKNAAIRAISEGVTKYTPIDGITSLKESIQVKFNRENNINYELDELIVCSGAKQVLFNLFMVTLDQDDEVIIPSPYWLSYPEIVRLTGGTPVIISSREDLKINLEILEKSISKKTKWLILNSPCNPSGIVYSREDFLAIGEILKKYPHVNIMCDDIYEHIIFDNLKFVTFAEVFPELKERIFIVNGVSKSYAMTGWRIGYGAGNQEVIKAMKKVQSQSTGCPTSISQIASQEALIGDQDYVKERTNEFQNRRDIALDILKNELNFKKPEGTFYIFPSCKEYFGTVSSSGLNINNSDDFVHYLLQEAGVLVLPGSVFGMNDHFRISIASRLSDVEKGCEKIISACQKLKKE